MFIVYRGLNVLIHLFVSFRRNSWICATIYHDMREEIHQPGTTLYLLYPPAEVWSDGRPAVVDSTRIEEIRNKKYYTIVKVEVKEDNDTQDYGHR